MSARPALCGGYHVSGIPTAISKCPAAGALSLIGISQQSSLGSRCGFAEICTDARQVMRRMLPGTTNCFDALPESGMGAEQPLHHSHLGWYVSATVRIHQRLSGSDYIARQFDSVAVSNILESTRYGFRY